MDERSPWQLDELLLIAACFGIVALLAAGVI